MCNAHQLHIPFKQTTKEAEVIYFIHFFFGQEKLAHWWEISKCITFWDIFLVKFLLLPNDSGAPL